MEFRDHISKHAEKLGGLHSVTTHRHEKKYSTFCKYERAAPPLPQRWKCSDIMGMERRDRQKLQSLCWAAQFPGACFMLL